MPRPLFFFGTLLDRDVLRHVLGVPIPPRRLTAARVLGYRRVRSRGLPYPHVHLQAGRCTEGACFLPTDAELERLDAFEGAEYVRLTARAIMSRGQRPERVELYTPAHPIPVQHAPWRLMTWTARHKKAMLNAIRVTRAQRPRLA